MAFSLLSDGATKPNWPHISCPGSGFAWHSDPRKQACFTGEVAVDADIVGRAIDGRDMTGIDRVLAIAALREETTGIVIHRIFRKKCPACGANHLELAEQAIRSARKIIHPGAIEALRENEVPIDLLLRRRPNKREDGPPKDESEAKRRARAARFLPFVEGDAVKTKAAQIAFAVQYGMRR